MKFLVILDTMWGGAGDAAPRWFHINPLNLSGKRLYRLTGASYNEMWITNACRERVRTASQHGKADTLWLYQSLVRLPAGWEDAPLLVCGTVAQATYLRVKKLYGTGSRQRGWVYVLKHPAARTWTNAELDATARRIQRVRNYPVR